MAHMQQSALTPRETRERRLFLDLHTLLADPFPDGTLLERDMSTVTLPTCAVPLHSLLSKGIADSHAIGRLGPLSRSTRRHRASRATICRVPLSACPISCCRGRGTPHTSTLGARE